MWYDLGKRTTKNKGDSMISLIFFGIKLMVAFLAGVAALYVAGMIVAGIAGIAYGTFIGLRHRFGKGE
jgi:threonine/homoserine efflux transporter RhtA